MAGKRKPTPKSKRRGFDTGGLYGGPGISSHSFGDSIMSGFSNTVGLANAAQNIGKYDKKPDDPNKPSRSPPPIGEDPNDMGFPGTVGGNARGGKIKRVAGKPIGKDDGLIPAQRGEYVVRKSAVKKLGTKVLNQVNRGKLPASRGR